MPKSKRQRIMETYGITNIEDALMTYILADDYVKQHHPTVWDKAWAFVRKAQKG
ncbi:hypothetical protein KAR91_35220 [Candidatus Pacearchaeota archaeon]|nr:hypothetical protein [Candidatus Pacearchaeota archaeon]